MSYFLPGDQKSGLKFKQNPLVFFWENDRSQNGLPDFFIEHGVMLRLAAFDTLKHSAGKITR